MGRSLLRIEAPYFVAGAECLDGRVVRAAPIVKYMIGWLMVDASAYATRKGWEVQRGNA
jgi:hypothetical protein